MSQNVQYACVQAAANLKDLNRHELKLFQQVIELENPDLFRWLTGQEKIPDEVWPPAWPVRKNVPLSHARIHATRTQMDNSVLRRLVEDLRGARVRDYSSRMPTCSSAFIYWMLCML